ncbi:MAG: hypothetical protein ACK57J_07130 [Rubrivivax sp.]
MKALWALRECATVAVTCDQRAVVYVGEDDRFDGICTLVSRNRIQPGGPAAPRW